MIESTDSMITRLLMLSNHMHTKITKSSLYNDIANPRHKASARTLKSSSLVQLEQ